MTFPRFFDAENMARGMKEVAPANLRAGGHDDVQRWFHGHGELDLFIWSDGAGRIVKQQLTFLGQVVEWNAVEGVRTGLVVEDENAHPRVKSSELVRFDLKPQTAPLNQARELLRFIDGLDESERAILTANFSPGPGRVVDGQTLANGLSQRLPTEADLSANRGLWRIVKSWLSRLFS